MRVKVEKLSVPHLIEMSFMPEFNTRMQHFPPERYEFLASSPYSYAARDSETNEIVACMGAAYYWKHRAEAWALLHPKADRYSIPLVRAFKRLLDESDIRRVEAAVRVGFAKGHKLARVLGFEKETDRLRCFTPEGDDCVLYARVDTTKGVNS